MVEPRWVVIATLRGGVCAPPVPLDEEGQRLATQSLVDEISRRNAPMRPDALTRMLEEQFGSR